MSQTVEVGQVWYGKYTGYEYKVIGIFEGCATLQWNEGFEREAPEAVVDILKSGDYILKK